MGSLTSRKWSRVLKLGFRQPLLNFGADDESTADTEGSSPSDIESSEVKLSASALGIGLPHATRSRLATLAAAALVAYGMVLRLTAYLSDRSFWGDEVAIALNVRLRGFLGLMHHLDFEQTMPIPLLEVIKASVKVFGPSEYTFRLPLLLAGCLILIAIWVFFRRLFEVDVALISLAMAAISRPLIYYSSELKQYGLDALVTVITLWFGCEVIREGERKDWWMLIAWGVFALCFSQPAVFVLAAVGVAAIIDKRFRLSGTWRIYCFIAEMLWLAVFTGLYLLSYREVSHSSYMRAFWASSFLYPTSGAFAREFLSAIYVLLGVEYFHSVRAMILEPLFIVGVYGVWRRFGMQVAVMAVLPFVAVLAAATVQRYPIANRLVVFTLPLTFLIYATALITISKWLPRRVSTAAMIVFPLGLLTATAIKMTTYAFHFPPREASRQIVTEMNAEDPVAPVYIVFDEYAQWTYYADDWERPDTLKENLTRAFHASSRVELLNAYGRKEIAGQAPDTPAGDRQWLDAESDAILRLQDGHVWLFVPIYVNNPVLGHNFMQRGLLERLQQRLIEGGAQLENSLYLGDTHAFRYRLPRRTPSS